MCSVGCFTIYIVAALLIFLPMLFVNMVTGAFVVLGFTPGQAFFLMLLSLAGAMINIPVKKWPETYIEEQPFFFAFPQFIQDYIVPKNKILAVNVGGAIIPGLISLWEVYRILFIINSTYPSAPVVFIIVFLLNTFICFKTAKPVSGKGIVIPAFIPPVTVSVASILLLPEIAPLIAFPAGVLGVLIGADILHLKDIRFLNAQVSSIGGAGTFDGIFLCGILSVFLTS